MFVNNINIARVFQNAYRLLTKRISTSKSTKNFQYCRTSCKLWYISYMHHINGRVNFIKWFVYSVNKLPDALPKGKLQVYIYTTFYLDTVFLICNPLFWYHTSNRTIFHTPFHFEENNHPLRSHNNPKHLRTVLSSRHWGECR